MERPSNSTSDQLRLGEVAGVEPGGLAPSSTAPASGDEIQGVGVLARPRGRQNPLGAGPAQVGISFPPSRSGRTPTPWISSPEAGAVDESETAGLNTSDFAEPELNPLVELRRPLHLRLPLQAPARFSGRRRSSSASRGAEGQSRPAFLGPQQLLPERARHRPDSPEHPGSTAKARRFVKAGHGTLRDGAYKTIGGVVRGDRHASRPRPDHALGQAAATGSHDTRDRHVYTTRVLLGDVVGISNLATFLKNTLGYRQDCARRVRRRARLHHAAVDGARGAAQTTSPRSPSRCSSFRDEPIRRVPRSEAEQMVAP